MVLRYKVPSTNIGLAALCGARRRNAQVHKSRQPRKAAIPKRFQKKT
jgi:hypothetical protein